MIPGKLLTNAAEHLFNHGRGTATVVVRNTADRLVQVSYHYHFAETNAALAMTGLLRSACG